MGSQKNLFKRKRKSDEEGAGKCEELNPFGRSKKTSKLSKKGKAKEGRQGNLEGLLREMRDEMRNGIRKIRDDM